VLSLLGDVLLDRCIELKQMKERLVELEDQAAAHEEKLLESVKNDHYEEKQRSMGNEIRNLQEKLERLQSSKTSDEIELRNRILEESSDKYETILNNVTSKYESQITRLEEEKNSLQVDQSDAKILYSELSKDISRLVIENDKLTSANSNLEAQLHELRSEAEKWGQKSWKRFNGNGTDNVLLASHDGGIMGWAEGADTGTPNCESINLIDTFERTGDKLFTKHNKGFLTEDQIMIKESMENPFVNHRIDTIESYRESWQGDDQIDLTFKEFQVEVNSGPVTKGGSKNQTLKMTNPKLDVARDDRGGSSTKKISNLNRQSDQAPLEICQPFKCEIFGPWASLADEKFNPKESEVSTCEASCMTEVDWTAYDRLNENVENLEEFIRNFEQEYNENQAQMETDPDEPTESQFMANKNEKEETECLLREYCSELEEKVKKMTAAENLAKQDLRRKDKKNLELYQENRAYVEKINEMLTEAEKLQEALKAVKKTHKDHMVIREQEIRKEVAKLWEERCQIKNEIKSKF
jgi:hypothetical protein